MVEWVLGGVRSDWQAAAFQATLASPDAFAAHYIDLHQDAAGNPEVPHPHTAYFVYLSIWTTDDAMNTQYLQCLVHMASRVNACLHAYTMRKMCVQEVHLLKRESSA